MHVTRLFAACCLPEAVNCSTVQNDLKPALLFYKHTYASTPALAQTIVALLSRRHGRCMDNCKAYLHMPGLEEGKPGQKSVFLAST